MEIKPNLLTVVIPVYNAEKYITSCLDSVLLSSLKNFDIVIVENGSNDSTLDLLAPYIQKNKRITLFTFKEKGLISAMNYGIEKAKTKYVAIMDSDDVCPPDRFEKQIEYLERNGDVVLVGTSIYYFINNRRKWKMKLPSENKIILSGIKKYRQMVFNPTIMFRKDIAKKINYYSLSDYPVPDLGFFLRMSSFGKISNITEVFQGTRLSDNSFTATNLSLINDKQISILEKHFITIKKSIFHKKRLLLAKYLYRKVIIAYLTNKYLKFLYYSLLTFIFQPLNTFIYLKNKLILK